MKAAGWRLASADAAVSITASWQVVGRAGELAVVLRDAAFWPTPSGSSNGAHGDDVSGVW